MWFSTRHFTFYAGRGEVEFDGITSFTADIFLSFVNEIISHSQPLSGSLKPDTLLITGE